MDVIAWLMDVLVMAMDVFSHTMDVKFYVHRKRFTWISFQFTSKTVLV